MFCKDKDELHFSIDFVCALAESVLCFKCKKLPKQPHSCINSHCSKAYCYLCVHKFEKCPSCHVKFSDKSYLTYYDLKFEFMSTMIQKFQKENVKLPLILRKVAAQMHFVSRKGQFEIGNSSKQTEFPNKCDNDYLMQENNPNLINNAVKHELANLSDDDERLSNGDANSDPAWVPDDSPKPTPKNPLRNKNKARIGAKVIKEAKVLEINKTIIQKDPVNLKTDVNIQSDSPQRSKTNLLKEKNANVAAAVQTIESKDIEGLEKKPLISKKQSKLSTNRHSQSESAETNETEKAKVISLNEAKSSPLGFDKLLKECANEKINKSLTERSSKEEKSIKRKSSNADEKEDTQRENESRDASENIKSTLNELENEEVSDSKEQCRLSPNESRLRLFTSKTYGKKNRSSVMGLIGHMKSAASMFNLELKDEQETEEENNHDVSNRSINESILNKYAVYELLKEDDKPIRSYKSSVKRKSNDLDYKDNENELGELFQTKKESKSNSGKRNKTTEDEAFKITNKRISPDDSIANTNREETPKRKQNQSNINKNSREIENLIRSKKLKIEENLITEEMESNEKQVKNDHKKIDIDRILRADKEINIVTRNTRQRQDDISTLAGSSNLDADAKKSQPRQTRRKKLSESSMDLSGGINEKYKPTTDKRTRATLGRATKKNNKATIDEIEDADPDIDENLEITPKTNPPKRARRTATSPNEQCKTTVVDKAKENDKTVENIKDVPLSTPKTNPSKRVRKTATSPNEHSKTTVIDKAKENDETVENIKDVPESTPKTNPKKRARKTATSPNEQSKTTVIDKTKENDETVQNSKNVPESTPKTNPRKRALKNASASDTSSTSTGEYFTPLSDTPNTQPTAVPMDVVLSTPKPGNGRNGSEFKEKAPEKLYQTPRVKTPATVKKSTLANPMYKRNMKGETPLHTACKKDANKVLSLLKNNMTPNVKDNAGWTPLHDAVSIGKESVVRLLLESGALVNVPGLDNDTPLHLAVRNERIDLAQLLIQYGADIGARNIHGYKPLEYFDLICRADLRSEVLAAQQLPRLSAPPRPLPPAPADLVLFMDQLDKTQASLVARFACTLATEERPILVSTLLQGNVNVLIVASVGERVCAPSTNVLKAILSGIRAVDVAWVSRCMELGHVVPTRTFEMDATTEYPDARPFQRSAENSEKLCPGLFNGLSLYLSRPWPPSCVLSCDETRDLIRRGGACLLNREPDPESMGEAEHTLRVMYHVTEPEHPLYRLSQGILYDARAPPRRLYNMSHVKGLSVDWFRACVQTFSIVPPVNPVL